MADKIFDMFVNSDLALLRQLDQAGLELIRVQDNFVQVFVILTP